MQYFIDRVIPAADRWKVPAVPGPAPQPRGCAAERRGGAAGPAGAAPGRPADAGGARGRALALHNEGGAAVLRYRLLPSIGIPGIT